MLESDKADKLRIPAWTHSSGLTGFGQQAQNASCCPAAARCRARDMAEVLDELDSLLDGLDKAGSKLLLLTGPSGSGKSRLLTRLAEKRGLPTLNIGVSLGQLLMGLNSSERQLQAAGLFRAQLEKAPGKGPLLLDNLELLFDAALKLNPLNLLQHSARRRPILAAWPGASRGSRLTYAEPGHPEYQNLAARGLLTFPVLQERASA